jgi:hypothetical protein
MNNYKISFLSLLALLFLLPLFFVPSLSVPLSLAKPIILFIGVFVGFIALLAFVLKYGELRVPQHKLIWVVLAFPLVYFISALLSGSSWLGLYGYNFEVGTFVSVLLASVVFFLSATVADGIPKILKLESIIFLSLFLAAIFSVVKIFSAGNLFVWNTFVGATSTPLGTWSDLGIALALLSILALLALEMLETSATMRWFMYAALVLSVGLLAVVNYGPAWLIVLIASLVILVYFITMEKPVRAATGEPQALRRVSRLAVALFAVSLLFVFNPTVSPTHGSLGATISNVFGVSSNDVSPSLSSTFSVSSPVLKMHPLFGSGPNTFANDWFLEKPLAINQTDFWSTSFNFGYGFLTTQIASVGLIGTLLWLAFLVLLLMLAGKALSRISPSSPTPLAHGERFFRLLLERLFSGEQCISMRLVSLSLCSHLLSLDSLFLRVLRRVFFLMQLSLSREMLFCILSLFLLSFSWVLVQLHSGLLFSKNPQRLFTTTRQ